MDGTTSLVCILEFRAHKRRKQRTKVECCVKMDGASYKTKTNTNREKYV